MVKEASQRLLLSVVFPLQDAQELQTTETAGKLELQETEGSDFNGNEDAFRGSGNVLD